MARAIEKGATYLDKLCHKLYDEPKGRGFQVDGKCRRCGGPLMTYYCEDRLHLIACEKCGTLALTKAVSPQVAANLTLRQPTLTPPNDALTLEQLQEMDGEPIYSGKYKRWFLVTYFAVLNRSQLMDSTGTPFVADDCGPLYLCPPEGEVDA